MTQKQFDEQMKCINDAWMKERAIYEDANIQLNKQRDLIKRQIAELKNRLDSISGQYQENVLTIKRINIKYHGMKHEFIVDHPKGSMEEG